VFRSSLVGEWVKGRLNSRSAWSMVIALDASSVVASVWAMMLTARIARMIGRMCYAFHVWASVYRAWRLLYPHPLA